VSGHSLKLHSYMFERSQMKHDNLDRQIFWNIFKPSNFYISKFDTNQKKKFHVQHIQTFKVDNPNFFSNILFFTNVHHSS